MNFRSKYITPSPIELFGAFFLAIAIVLLANTQRLLNYYGLYSSDVVIRTSAGSAVRDALTVLDTFSFTNTVVLFLIWAAVGVLCFGLLEALGNAFREFKLEQDVSSRKYIHPSTFTRVSFWRGVVVNAWAAAICLGILVGYSLLLLLFVIPLGLAYSRIFLLDISLNTALYFVVGILIIFAGLVLLNIAVRFMLHRRTVFNLS